MTGTRSHELQFRPRARLVSILGEHLISDQAVGLIELVKNGYDADASMVTVEILDTIDPAKTTVVIADNGTGMTIDDIQLKWLSPAVDHKEQEKRQNKRTKLGRLPIGEKGVGRFSVHQLGRKLEMITRAADAPEIVVEIDWDVFDTSEGYLDSKPVRVLERDPVLFTGSQAGTRICIRAARAPWTEKLLRKVHRTLRRLQSPIVDEDRHFAIRFQCPEFPALENIDPSDILNRAHYDFRALVNADGTCDLEYVCKHPAVTRREESAESVDLISSAENELDGGTPRCGPFWINLHVWDRTKDYLRTSDVSRPELDAMCGISLFRDGLRVLPYGEPGDDWLFLDQERVQQPSERIGNNQVIGFVQFDQSANLQLRDKTNREGLIENDAFNDLRALVRAALKQFIKYWKNDRPPARETRPSRPGNILGAQAVADALRASARDDVEVKVPPDAIPSNRDAKGPVVMEMDRERIQVMTQRRAVDLILQHIEGARRSIMDRDDKLERITQLAGTGLAAERVIHEFGRHIVTAAEAVETMRGVHASDPRIDPALTKIEIALDTLRSEFRILAPYEMTGRKPRIRRVSVREIAELAVELNRMHLTRRNIATSVDGQDWNIRVKVTPFLQILDNLVHNASSWTATVPEDGPRRIGIILDDDRSRILVADTGPGIDAEVVPHLFEPFTTMKTEGKGLGLYISSELAQALGGRLRLADEAEVQARVPWADGAVFVLELDASARTDHEGEDTHG